MGKETDESDAPLHVEITGVKLMGGSQDLLKMKIMKITVGGEIKHLPLVEICRKTAHFFFTSATHARELWCIIIVLKFVMKGSSLHVRMFLELELG